MQALTEDLLDILASRFQAAARGFRGRIEIDHVIAAVAPAVSPAIVHSGSFAIGPGGGELVLDGAVTPGNILLYLGSKRGASGPNPPSTVSSAPRFGSGAWTDLTPASVQAEWDTHHDPPNYYTGSKVYAKVADSPSSSGLVDEYTVSEIYELAGCTLAGITIVYKTLQALGTNHDIGSLGSPAAGLPAFLMLALGADGSVSLTPDAAWIRDIHADGYGRTWASDTNTTGLNQPAPPEVWIGHAIGAGAAIEAHLTGATAHKWAGIGVLLAPSDTGVPATVETAGFTPSRLGIDKSRRMTAAQADIELPNEAGEVGVAPDSVVQTDAPVRIYEWYGDIANEVLTFTGLVDLIHEARDPRNVRFTCRDMMKRLIVQTFSTSAPQNVGEAGAVRTAANGVYLAMEVDAIVSDILDRAGWPTLLRDITPTSYLLDEYVLSDGASWADSIIGDDKLTGLTGYEAGAREDGTFFFRPVLAAAGTVTGTDPAPVYSYVIAAAGADDLVSRNVIKLDHEIDDYTLKTRVKVRGSLTTLKDAWTEVWHTNVIRHPSAVRYDPADATHIYVADGLTHKIYKILQSTRAIVSATAAMTTHFINGLSTDPADATIYWILETPWIDGSGAHSFIHKVTKATNVIAASYDIGTDHWTALKADASNLWLTNFTTNKVHKYSKVGVSVASYSATYTSPVGLAIDGTDIYVAFYGRNVMLKYAAPAFTTVLRTLRFSGTRSLGGDLDTTTHTELYAVAYELGLVYKMTLASPVDEAVAVEVVDTALEDSLGLLSGAQNREHDTHPGDADHPFEIRRETITLRKTITSLAQATESAQRALAVLAHRREVVDLGIVGNPGHQLGDLIQATDPVTGVDALYVIDTYRDNMDERGFLGTAAVVPYDPVY